MCVWGGTSEFLHYKWEAEVTTAKDCEEECLAEDWAVAQLLYLIPTAIWYVMFSLIQVT